MPENGFSIDQDTVGGNTKRGRRERVGEALAAVKK